MSNVPEYSPIHQGVPPDSVTQAYGSMQAACAAWQKTTPSHDQTIGQMLFPHDTPCSGVDYSIASTSAAYLYLGIILAVVTLLTTAGLWFAFRAVSSILASVIYNLRVPS